MNKFLCGLILFGTIFSSYRYNGNTMSAVIVAGSVIKAQNTVVDHKYPRKDCPVCFGKGYYISGDKITKVDCGYCEAEKKTATSPPICTTGTCKVPLIIKR
jgi:hypothetical protein